MASATVLSGLNSLAAGSLANVSGGSIKADGKYACPSLPAKKPSAKHIPRPSQALRVSSFVNAQTSRAFGVAPGKAVGGANGITCKIDLDDKAPDFTLKDQSGKDVSLSKFKGKPVVLYFYPKDDTPGCTKQACYFRDSYEAYKSAGAEVVGISADSVDSHKAFAAKHNLPFKLLADENGKVRKEFGISNDFLGALPGRQTYLLDGEGTVKLVYNNQFMPEKHISETLRVIEKITPEKKVMKDLPKVGLGMIGKILHSDGKKDDAPKDDDISKFKKIFKNPEQISKGKKEEEEPGMLKKIFKNPEQIPRGGKKEEEF